MEKVVRFEGKRERCPDSGVFLNKHMLNMFKLNVRIMTRIRQEDRRTSEIKERTCTRSCA